MQVKWIYIYSYIYIYIYIKGLPRWLSGKESACQCRKCKSCGFDSWARKIPWSRKWKPTPIFLPGKSHGQKSLAGYNPWSHKSDMTEWPNNNTKSTEPNASAYVTFFLLNVTVVDLHGICKMIVLAVLKIKIKYICNSPHMARHMYLNMFMCFPPL